MQLSQQGGVLSATSPMQLSQQGGVSSSSPLFSATSPLNQQNGGANLSSVTSSLPINYDSLVGGKKKNNKEKKTKKSDESSSSTKSESSGKLLMMDDMDASSSSTASESMSDSDAIIARALRSDVPSEKTRNLQRFSPENPKQNKKHKSKDDTPSTNSSTSSSSTSTYSSSTKTTSGTSISSSSTDGEAIAKVNSYKYANLVITSPNSASASDSLINAKQFYSSENGELFSSDSNFLRQNINKNRLR
jgi:hypothetical protein